MGNWPGGYDNTVVVSASTTTVNESGQYTVSYGGPTDAFVTAFLGINSAGSATLPSTAGALRLLQSFAGGDFIVELTAGDRLILGYDVVNSNRNIPFTEAFSAAGLVSITAAEPLPAPALRITTPRESFRYSKSLTVRGRSTEPLSSLQAKVSGSRFRTMRASGTSWRVSVPRNILRRKRAVTVSVRGADAEGNLSSIVSRRYRKATARKATAWKVPFQP